MAGFSPAYFISPKGKVVYVSNHITAIIRNPNKFGISKEFIKDQYEKYNERMGQEGKARESIILMLVNRGWIRIRRYGDNVWSINTYILNPKNRKFIINWAKTLLKGTPDFREYDGEILVDIKAEVGRGMKIPFKELAGEISEDFDDLPDIEFVKSFDNLPDIINNDLIDKIDEMLTS